MKTYLLTILLSIICAISKAQNPVIGPNERIDYEIYYAFVTGATMTLQTDTVTENGQKLYHLVAKGNTIGFIDKIYHIMEDYESWADPKTLLPVHALKNVRESEKYKRYITYDFDHENHKVVSSRSGEQTIKNQCFDIVGACYKLRMHDLSKLYTGQTITLNTFFGEENWPLIIKYIKTETIKVGKLGKILCYKFVPVVEVSGVFTDKDALSIWISADENKIPIRAQMSLMVGSAKVDITSYKNLIHPLNFQK